MTDTKPVVVYGASGYTGRLACEYLREYNVPFIAAGRDRKRIEEGLATVPGVGTVEHEVVEVEHKVEALTELFAGASVVCNLVGPFIKYGPVAAEAALAAGCHYMDTTGEQDWVMYAQANWGEQYKEKGLLLSPGIAHMYTTSEIAANICLETPGLDSLDIVSMFNGFPTYASTQTIFHSLKSDWYQLQQNQYVQWDRTSKFEINVPGQHDRGLALPWGGMSHPVWFKDDPRVANVRSIGGVYDRTVMEGVIETLKMIEEKIKPLPAEQQEAALSAIAGSVQAGMPPRENPRINKSIDSVHASGPLARAHCIIHGNCNYKQTGLLQAYAAYSLLQQPPRRAGLASACQAFGHRELLGVLRSFGLVLNPIVEVHS
ncbi:DUF5938 domain-containing protein [Rhodococcus xishaensis]|uniref:Saccharopine dehydrogenase n=1 Tax=Rhodococcus xishaensis TaxID=2487364 RepID=A0A3S3BJF0_9NOCA|nr:DUF5938 domain-containing protein [Rhodococcus xishaensis]RVW02758.1 saccharopine dehydrogenase [Rhodococcus xishaensis]